MLTQEQNERLTHVGPGTPMGEMLRRYWHPVTTVAELDAEPVEPVTLLPRFEIFVNPEMDRDVGISRLPCNWLQVAENTVDPAHIEYLHMKYTNYVHRRKGLPEVGVRHHERMAFEVFEYGLMKRRLWEGDSEDSDEWTIGHPQLLPGTAMVMAGQ